MMLGSFLLALILLIRSDLNLLCESHIAERKVKNSSYKPAANIFEALLVLVSSEYKTT